MKPVMYLFLNRDLGMSTGKAAAQIAHAAVSAFEISDTKMVTEWKLGGHVTKIVLLAEDSHQLHTIDRYLRDREFKTTLIIDEGRTEIEKFSPTALGVEVVDKDDPHVAASFGEFKLYRDKRPEVKVTFGAKARKMFG